MEAIPESDARYSALEEALSTRASASSARLSHADRHRRATQPPVDDHKAAMAKGKWVRAMSLDSGIDDAKSGHVVLPAPEGAKEITGRHYTWRYNMPNAGSPASSAKRTHDGSEAFRLLRKISGTNHQQHKLNIHRIHHISWLYELYLKDIFHTLANLKLKHLLILFVAVYMLAFCALAACFMLVNDRCKLGLETFAQAFALSVETWLTIGYGVADPPGPYLKQCPEGVVIVTVQGLVGLLMNAFVVGIVMVSVSSGAFRGCTLIFSEKAVIREVNGRLYLMIQVCEMRSTQLLEAHVRAYVIRKPAGPGEVPFDSPAAFELRLIQPDDSTGALMLPVLPSVIVHEIDHFSPLGPPARGRDAPLQNRHWTRPGVRQSDADVGNRCGVWCRTCGEQFPCEDMLQAHIAYAAEQDALSGATKHAHRVEVRRSNSQSSIASTLSELRGEPMSRAPSLVHGVWRKRVEEFIDSQWFEILCVLEGVDTTTAATVQARHSYVAEDIVWDHTFAPIFALDTKLGGSGAVLDFTRMHDLVPADPV